MEHSIPIEKLTAVHLNKNKNAISVNKKEIRIGEEWFDVVYKIGEGDNEVFYCLSDKNESKIMKAIESGNQKEKQQGLISFIKSFSKEYPTQKFWSLLPENIFSKSVAHEFAIEIHDGYSSAIFSPPDFS